MYRPMLGFAVVMLLGSCSDEVRSCDLETRAIAMRVTVTDGDDGVEVEIIVEVGTDDDDDVGTPLALCPDSDKLTVNSQPTELTRVLDQLYYRASFAEPAGDYRIELLRDEFEDATITVVMPPTLEILAPLEGSDHPRDVALDIEWAPPWPGHTLDLAVEDEIGSDCLTGLGYAMLVDDSGSHQVPANALFGTMPGQMSTCNVWAALTRTTQGEYPVQLHPNGSVIAYVKRRRPFSSSQ